MRFFAGLTVLALLACQPAEPPDPEVFYDVWWTADHEMLLDEFDASTLCFTAQSNHEAWFLADDYMDGPYAWTLTDGAFEIDGIDGVTFTVEESDDPNAAWHITIHYWPLTFGFDSYECPAYQ